MGIPMALGRLTAPIKAEPIEMKRRPILKFEHLLLRVQSWISAFIKATQLDHRAGAVVSEFAR